MGGYLYHQAHEARYGQHLPGDRAHDADAEGVDRREIFRHRSRTSLEGSLKRCRSRPGLTEGCETDSEKVERIGRWIPRTSATTTKIPTGSGYLPDLDQVLRDKKGICYDYASLFAGL